jgi:hypothetical protein
MYRYRVHAEELSPILCDESRWPFVIITLPARELNDEEFLTHVTQLKSYETRGGRFGLVIDARLAPLPNPARRRMVADAMDHAVDRGGRRCIGVVIVLDSAIQRAVFNTLQWLRRTKHPMTSTTTPKEGLAWLRHLQQFQIETHL